MRRMNVITSLLLLSCAAYSDVVAQAKDPSSKIAAQVSGRSLGPHIIVATVRPERAATDPSQYGLTRQDFEAIITTIPTVQLAVPVREIRRQTQFSDRNMDVQLVGTAADYIRVHERSIARGRFLIEEDTAKLRNVAVIGDRVARNFFFGEDPLGKSIRVDKHYFLVVGTVEARRDRERVGVGDDPGYHVYIPISTMRSRFGDREVVRRAGTFSMEHFKLSRIEILVQDVSQIRPAAAVIEKLLDRYHDEKTYTVTTSLDNEAQR